MSRILAFTMLALVAASGTASACSLAYQPFEHPSWEGQLRYVDGNELRTRDGARDLTLATGFFVTYAAQGDRLVVSGQEGLGADCSGDGWLRVMEDRRVVQHESGLHRVFVHGDGAIVVKGPEVRLLPWDGGNERALSRLPGDARVQAWSPGLHPAFDDRGVTHAAGRTLESPSGPRPAFAAGPDGMGVLVVADDRAKLYEVPDDPAAPVQMRSWPATEGWPVKLAWADEWNAIVSDELFVIGDAVQRVDIGAEPVSLGERSGRLLAFHENGYVELDGVRAVSAANREGDTWQATKPTASAGPVAATSWTTSNEWSGPSADSDDHSGPVETIPFPGPALALLALACVAARRMRL